MKRIIYAGGLLISVFVIFGCSTHQASEETGLPEVYYNEVDLEAPEQQVKVDLSTAVNQEFSIAQDGTPILLPVEFRGQQHWFVLDTGATMTMFDMSLKGQLGPVLRTQLGMTAGEPIEVEVFEGPEAFLGSFNL